MSEKCPLFTHLCAFKRDASIPNGKIYTLLCYGCDYHNVLFRILHVLSYRGSTLLSCISASVHRCYNAQNKKLLICSNLLYLHKTHTKIPSVASGLTDTACLLHAKLEKNKSTKTERERKSMSILTNPVTVSVIVLCVLSLLKLNVLLAMLVACIAGGLAGGIPIYAAEGDSVMKLLTSGFSGNATTALAYILLGTFATAIATTGLADIVSKKLSKIIGTTSRHDHPDRLPVSEPHPHSHRLYPHPDSSHARADEQDAPRPPRCGLLPCLRS